MVRRRGVRKHHLIVVDDLARVMEETDCVSKYHVQRVCDCICAVVIVVIVGQGSTPCVIIGSFRRCSSSSSVSSLAANPIATNAFFVFTVFSGVLLILVRLFRCCFGTEEEVVLAMEERPAVRVGAPVSLIVFFLFFLSCFEPMFFAFFCIPSSFLVTAAGAVAVFLFLF